MKSVLQQDRETQLDRQRRYLFCYTWAELKSTFLPSKFGVDRDRTLLMFQTVYVFQYRLTQKACYSAQYLRKFHHFVTIEQLEKVLSWFSYTSPFPEALKAISPTHHIGCKAGVSIEWQQDAAKNVRTELARCYQFTANNVDRDFTDEEQAEAQEKLRQLLALPDGL